MAPLAPSAADVDIGRAGQSRARIELGLQLELSRVGRGSWKKNGND